MKNEMGFLEGTFAVQLLRQQHTIVCSFWKDLYYGQPKNLARAIFTAYSPCWAEKKSVEVFRKHYFSFPPLLLVITLFVSKLVFPKLPCFLALIQMV